MCGRCVSCVSRVRRVRARVRECIAPLAERRTETKSDRAIVDQRQRQRGRLCACAASSAQFLFHVLARGHRLEVRVVRRCPRAAVCCVVGAARFILNNLTVIPSPPQKSSQ